MLTRDVWSWTIDTSADGSHVRKLFENLQVHADKVLQKNTAVTGEAVRGIPIRILCKGVRCPPIFSLSNLIDAGWL